VQRLFLVIASLSGAIAVILGAFGAHGLKHRLDPEQLQAFETGVRYQMFHTLALLAVVWLGSRFQHVSLAFAGYAFVAGMLLFSGSLYLLSCKSLLGIESWKWLGPVTPLGGLCFILGWICMLAGAALAR